MLKLQLKKIIICSDYSKSLFYKSSLYMLTAASKALLRLASSYRTHPKAQMSLFWLYLLSLRNLFSENIQCQDPEHIYMYVQDTGVATDMMEFYTDHSHTNKIIFTCAAILVNVHENLFRFSKLKHF